MITEVLRTGRNINGLGRDMDYIVTWTEPDRESGIDIAATKEKIAAMMQKKDLKDKTIADHMMISPQAANKWRHKIGFPGIDNLYILSGLLKVNLDDLIVPMKYKTYTVMIETEHFH